MSERQKWDGPKAPHDTHTHARALVGGRAAQAAGEAESERMMEREHGNRLQVPFSDGAMAVLRWTRARR